LLDNSKLDISYVYDCKNVENIEFIEIKEYTLKDENDNLRVLYYMELKNFQLFKNLFFTYIV